MNLFLSTTLPALIIDAERKYRNGASKKVMVMSAIDSLLTTEDKQLLNPLISEIIDLSVKLMAQPAMLNRKCCFRK